MPNHHPKHKEEKTAKMIEGQTTKTPSNAFLWAALGTMALSLGLFTKNKKAGVFVGLWAPSLLIIGLYNKLMKTEGHDSEDITAGASSKPVSAAAF